VTSGRLRTSSSAVPLAAALLIVLGMPLSASTVTYDVRLTNSPSGVGFTFTTPDFLPVLAPDATVFTPTSGTVVNCGALPSFYRCGNASLQLNQSGFVTAFIKVFGGEPTPFDSFNLFELTFLDVDLRHVGQWNASQGSATLTISQSADPVPTPEPGTFLLAAPAMAGFWLMRRRKAA
jgi:hypothetical protein